MKKTSVFLFAVSILFFSGNSMNLTALEENASVSEKGDGWASYSTGLYYKNLAVNAKSRDERNSLLEKAIVSFSESLKSKNSMGRVYFQISECHYLMGNPEKTENFARMSIEADKDYFPPYNRIYGLKIAAKNYEEGAKIIEQYLQLKPDNTYSLYLMGVHYFKYAKKPDKSLEMFKKVIENSKKGDVPVYYLENSYYNTGFIYYSKSLFSKAAFFFKKVYEMNNSNSNAVFMLAESNMNFYNVKEAEKYALMYQKIYPKNTKIRYILARIYYLEGNEKALEYLAGVKRTRSFEGLVSLALYNELTGNDKDAEKVLNAIMKHGNNLISPYVAISRIRLRQDDKEKAYRALVNAGTAAFRNSLFDAAERMFYKALELKKGDAKNIYYYLARTHEEKEKYSLAISYYIKYYNFSKENSILVHIGYLYGVQKKFNSAYPYFDRAQKIEPDSPTPLFFRGLIQIWDGKYMSAGKNIKAAIKLRDDDESFYFYQAVVYEKIKDIDKAVESLKLAIKYNPRSARAANYLGYLYTEKGIHLDEAQKLIETALELQPENGAYLDSLGWIYFKKEDYQNALSYLLSAEVKLDQSDSPDSVVYDHIGDTYLKLGNKKMALLYWRRALKLEKNKTIEQKIIKAEEKQEIK